MIDATSGLFLLLILYNTKTSLTLQNLSFLVNGTLSTRNKWKYLASSRNKELKYYSDYFTTHISNIEITKDALHKIIFHNCCLVAALQNMTCKVTRLQWKEGWRSLQRGNSTAGQLFTFLGLLCVSGSYFKDVRLQSLCLASLTERFAVCLNLRNLRPEIIKNFISYWDI